MRETRTRTRARRLQPICSLTCLIPSIQRLLVHVSDHVQRLSLIALADGRMQVAAQKVRRKIAEAMQTREIQQTHSTVTMGQVTGAQQQHRLTLRAQLHGQIHCAAALD